MQLNYRRISELTEKQSAVGAVIIIIIISGVGGDVLYELQMGLKSVISAGHTDIAPLPQET